jgi:hypothetical protein
MKVDFSLPGALSFIHISFSFNVVTNVVRGHGAESSGVATDVDRTQASNTHPTQVANGTYRITQAKSVSPGAGNVAPEYKYGNPGQGLVLDVTQMLPDVDHPDQLNADTGYMVHITPYGNTDGCIGIPYTKGDPSSRKDADGIMRFLVSLFNKTMSKEGDKDATIEFKD